MFSSIYQTNVTFVIRTFTYIRKYRLQVSLKIAKSNFSFAVSLSLSLSLSLPLSLSWKNLKNLQDLQRYMQMTAAVSRETFRRSESSLELFRAPIRVEH